MLEIELNESLRRRREELQSKLDSLGEVDAGASAFSEEELSARTRELKALKSNIKDLQKRAAGAEHFYASHPECLSKHY